MSKVNFNFISELEGYSLAGYVPDAGNSKSGVTIASGFDLGQCSIEQIDDAFDCDLADKLEPYVGIKGLDAVRALEKSPLIITNSDASTINKYTHDRATDILTHYWDRASRVPFRLLSEAKQTVVASVAFQYGNLSTQCPNFWRQTTSGDWSSALANLRNFGDRYPTRRNTEGDLLESDLT